MKALRSLNTFLAVSAGILAIYMVINIKNTYNPVMQAGEEKKISSVQLLPEITLENQALFKSKPLFNIYVNRAKLKENEDFVLLGVSFGKKNLAMIRDVQANKDYYCAEGDSIADFKVKSILKDKVILESDKDTLVLTP